MQEYATPPRSARPAEQTQPELRTPIRIEIGPDGLRISIEYTGSLSSIPTAIERLRAAGVLELAERGKPSAPGQAAPAALTRAERVAPTYKPDGTACCPVHHKPLVEGRYGLYCPSKAQADEQANPKGYCSLRFLD